MALSGEGIVWLPSNPPPEECLMDRTDNVIDFARYRSRRQARRLGEMMWAVYAWRPATPCRNRQPGTTSAAAGPDR